MQLSLFDENEKNKPKKNDEEYPYIIYASTSKGSCLGILYECKTEVGAQNFIKNEKTKGYGMGAEWAYFYTKKSNLPDFSIKTYKQYKTGSLKKLQADDRFNDVLKKYGLKAFGK